MPQVVRGAVVFTGGLEIDADGSPHSYHPGGGGLDALANAGRPGNWYGLACDSEGNPCVQGANDPAPGYYVSQTALCDSSKAMHDPCRYVDSETVPYVSVPPDVLPFGVRMGDVCMVLHGVSQCAAVVADVGPRGKYGEGSIALAKALGIPDSPRNGGVSNGVTYVLFPHSAQIPKWPRTNEDVATQTEQLFAEWGGLESLQCA